jgi:hypothetical protein
MHFCIHSVAVEKYSTNGFVSMSIVWTYKWLGAWEVASGENNHKKSLKFLALHSFEYDDTTLYLFPLSRLQRKEKFKTVSNYNNNQQLIMFGIYL